MVIFSENEEDYKRNIQEIVQVAPSEVVRYLESTWLQYIDRFVRLHTGRYLHLGTSSTSRGEGAHYVVKRYIKIATLDLLQVNNFIIIIRSANEYI